jgi:hypothetical protein
MNSTRGMLPSMLVLHEDIQVSSSMILDIRETRKGAG